MSRGLLETGFHELQRGNKHQKGWMLRLPSESRHATVNKHKTMSFPFKNDSDGKA